MESYSPALTINVSQTQYTVVSDVASELGWRLSQTCKEDWDLCWMDTGMTPERLIRLRPYQRINHYPGMHSLSHKNHLAVNLTDMQQFLPSEYDFFPETWVLPKSYGELKRVMDEEKDQIFIVKPEAESQGRGIFLIKELEKIPSGTRCIVQRYLHPPLLLDGLKFDLRLYVLVTKSDPISIYLHEEGLARFATLPYKQPSPGNFAATWMHLTNYAINKNNPGYQFNSEEDEEALGHKRSLFSVFSRLSSEGHNPVSIWSSISDLITKTILSISPLLTHIYHSCQPHAPNLCFELLGFDILLDKEMKPWLLEVNHSPSFNTDTPLDRKVKRKVIRDVFGVIGLTGEERIQYLEGLREKSVQTLVLDRPPGRKLLSPLNLRTSQVRQRRTVLGGFQLLYPTSSHSSLYSSCLETACHIYKSRLQKPRIPRELSPISVTNLTPLRHVRPDKSGQEEPRRLSFSTKRPVKLPSAVSVGLDTSFLRPIVLRKIPKGACLHPKSLKFSSSNGEMGNTTTYVKHIYRLKQTVTPKLPRDHK